MDSARLIAEARPHLWSRQQLRARGVTERGIEQALQKKQLHRIRRGWYVDGEFWKAAFSESRHLLEMLATVAASPKEPLFSHESAAILHDLPLFRFRGARPQTVVSLHSRTNGSSRVSRRARDLDEVDFVRIGPFMCTSLARTVLDIARNASREVAVGCVDAGLHKLGGSARAQEVWRNRWLEQLDAEPHVLGNATARAVIKLADGGADSVAESVSRLYLLDLGFDVATQVGVRSPKGSEYRVDFELRGIGVFGEVDGTAKYIDPELTEGKSAQQRLLEEKEREDWIRGVTGFRLIRWGLRNLTSAEALGARIEAFGIPVPIRPHRLRAAVGRLGVPTRD